MSKLDRVAAILVLIQGYFKKYKKIRVHLVVWDKTNGNDDLEIVNEWDVTEWFAQK